MTRREKLTDSIKNYPVLPCFSIFIPKSNYEKQFEEMISETSKLCNTKPFEEFKCTICERFFGAKAELHKHNQCVHRNKENKKYECRDCKKVFGKFEHLKRHLSTSKKHGFSAAQFEDFLKRLKKSLGHYKIFCNKNKLGFETWTMAYTKKSKKSNSKTKYHANSQLDSSESQRVLMTDDELLAKFGIVKKLEIKLIKPPSFIFC